MARKVNKIYKRGGNLAKRLEEILRKNRDCEFYFSGNEKIS